MKKILLFITVCMVFGCKKSDQQFEALKAAELKLQNNLENYSTVWEKIFEDRAIDLINLDHFDKDVTVVTADGDIQGIDAFRAYYNNYLLGFSDAEFVIIDIFGHGDKLVKHWNFKGTHDGEMFGIPATNKKLNLYGTTLVEMKDGKIYKEEDFFDNYSFLNQLGLLD